LPLFVVRTKTGDRHPTPSLRPLKPPGDTGQAEPPPGDSERSKRGEPDRRFQRTAGRGWGACPRFSLGGIGGGGLTGVLLALITG